MVLRRPRWLALLSLAIVLPLGLGSKVYSGPLAAWVNHFVGGAIYELVWCLLLFAIWPRRSAIAPIVLGVFLATCALEFLQLWQPAWLMALRATWLGRSILGSVFSELDFVYYLLGSLLAWVWLRALDVWSHTRYR